MSTEKLTEFGDAASLRVGDLASHGLIGLVKIVHLKGSRAEVTDRTGKRYLLQLTSLKPGKFSESTIEENYGKHSAAAAAYDEEISQGSTDTSTLLAASKHHERAAKCAGTDSLIKMHTQKADTYTNMAKSTRNNSVANEAVAELAEGMEWLETTGQRTVGESRKKAKNKKSKGVQEALDVASLHVGDPLIIVGKVALAGETGTFVDTDSSGGFIVVKMDDGTRHSFSVANVKRHEPDDMDEAFPHDVDHMHGAMKRNGEGLMKVCPHCNGNRHVWTNADKGKTPNHPWINPNSATVNSKMIPCPTCEGGRKKVESVTEATVNEAYKDGGVKAKHKVVPDSPKHTEAPTYSYGTPEDKKDAEFFTKAFAKPKKVKEGRDPTIDSSQESRGFHHGEVRKCRDGSYIATNLSGSRKSCATEKEAKAHAETGKQDANESQFVKEPSGHYRNMHTGVLVNKPGENLGEPSNADKLNYYRKELARLKASPTPYKTHIAHAEKMIRRYSKGVVEGPGDENAYNQGHQDGWEGTPYSNPFSRVDQPDEWDDYKSGYQYGQTEAENEFSVEEGIDDTIKRGVKSIKRGMQGWGNQGYKNMTDKETPRDLVNRNKGYDDEKVKSLSKFRKAVDQERPAPAHSPQALQNRVLDREMKKRGLGEAEKNPHTSALGKALYRDLSKQKKVSPAQQQRNKERWAQRQAQKEQDNHNVRRVDMTGKTCVKCKQGKYQETSQMDDMDGKLHCVKCGSPTTRWKKHAEKGINETGVPIVEAPARDTVKALITAFNQTVGGDEYGPLDYHPPGFRVWTRGDGSRYRDPGTISADEYETRPEQKAANAKSLAMFWDWLVKQPGVKSIGTISGEFGSSTHHPAVSYKGLYFKKTHTNVVQYGAMSRIKNPRAVWRNKPDQQGMTEGDSDASTVYPNAQVIKTKKGRAVGEIYQDEFGWGCFHYRADTGYDCMDSREHALDQLKEMDCEYNPRSRGVEEDTPGYVTDGYFDEAAGAVKGTEHNPMTKHGKIFVQADKHDKNKHHFYVKDRGTPRHQHIYTITKDGKGVANNTQGNPESDKYYGDLIKKHKEITRQSNTLGENMKKDDSAIEWFKLNKPVKCKQCDRTSFHRASHGHTHKIVCSSCGNTAATKEFMKESSILIEALELTMKEWGNTERYADQDWHSQQAATPSTKQRGKYCLTKDNPPVRGQGFMCFDSEKDAIAAWKELKNNAGVKIVRESADFDDAGNALNESNNLYVNIPVTEEAVGDDWYAKLVRMMPDDLNTENEVLNVGFEITKRELGIKTAKYMFNVDPDFQQDLVSEYARLHGSLEYDESLDAREFKQQELDQELRHERNNYQVMINGKTWRVFADKTRAMNLARAIQQKYPSKKVQVGETGAAVTESTKVQTTKPRNFVAKHMKTGGAGAHTDKKRAAKQGDVKHKGKLEESEDGYAKVEKAIAQHKRTLANKLATPANVAYAQKMIARGKEALKKETGDAAYKHFQG